jgi:hypothetical protein
MNAIKETGALAKAALNSGFAHYPQAVQAILFSSEQ